MQYRVQSIVIVSILCLFGVKCEHEYGSKTPYDQINTDWQQVLLDGNIDTNVCQLSQLRVILRHGTRTWSEKNAEAAELAVEKIIQSTNGQLIVSSKAGSGSLTPEQVEAIRSWQNVMGTDNGLLPLGKAEHEFLARDYAQLIEMFPLMKTTAHLANFQSSPSQRSIDSGSAFQGVWNELYNISEPSQIEVAGEQLRFFDYCPLFTERVRNNDSTSLQAQKANESTDGIDLVSKVNKIKLSLSNDVLELEDLTAMQKAAAFENIQLGGSVFQPLFELEDESFMEYVDDLQHFYEFAYGDKVIGDMSCILLNDVFDNLESSSNNNNTRMLFGFGHYETLMPVYAALDLFHDPAEKMVWSADRQFYEHRLFDSSEIGNFASNIAFLFVSSSTWCDS